jgi:hypothetical protein
MSIKFFIAVALSLMVFFSMNCEAGGCSSKPLGEACKSVAKNIKKAGAAVGEKVGEAYDDFVKPSANEVPKVPDFVHVPKDLPPVDELFSEKLNKLIHRAYDNKAFTEDMEGIENNFLYSSNGEVEVGARVFKLMQDDAGDKRYFREVTVKYINYLAREQWRQSEYSNKDACKLATSIRAPNNPNDRSSLFKLFIRSPRAGYRRTGLWVTITNQASQVNGLECKLYNVDIETPPTACELALLQFANAQQGSLSLSGRTNINIPACEDIAEQVIKKSRLGIRFGQGTATLKLDVTEYEAVLYVKDEMSKVDSKNIVAQVQRDISDPMAPTQPFQDASEEV